MTEPVNKRKSDMVHVVSPLTRLGRGQEPSRLMNDVKTIIQAQMADAACDRHHSDPFFRSTPRQMDIRPDEDEIVD